MTKGNGQKQFLWKLVAVLMSVLVVVGGYLHGRAINDLDTQELRVQSLEVRSALLEQATYNIQEKQDKMDITLIEVRDAVIRIEGKIN